MSETPSAIKERDALLEKERVEARAYLHAQAETWRRLKESNEWTQIQEIVAINREECLKNLLNLDYRADNYGTMAAHLQGYIRAMDWLLALPQQAIDKGK